ncbi:MAG TPA: hypothetical protein DCL43_05805 [Chitinophagaceae bacterium]|nr:hypothetical protein [Chitinophagaceae bacterium]HAN38862.1 hypothetical protein [Chitinophagaceae bacterium]
MLLTAAFQLDNTNLLRPKKVYKFKDSLHPIGITYEPIQAWYLLYVIFAPLMQAIDDDFL